MGISTKFVRLAIFVVGKVSTFFLMSYFTIVVNTMFIFTNFVYMFPSTFLFVLAISKLI